MTISKRRAYHIALFALLLAALLFATGALFAQIRADSGDVVDIDDILPDMAFFAAGDLNVTAKSTDDIFAAGGDVSLRGAQADHMIAAGGDIIVTEVAFHDLMLAGGDIAIVSGSVTDDIVAAGGDVAIESGVRIGGSAVLAGGDVTIDAPVGRELRAAGGRVRLNANVGGDAHLTGDTITIGPNVRIGGDLTHRARSIEISPSAEIVGEVIELEPPERPDFEALGVKAAAAAAVFALAFLIGVGVLVVVIALVLPGLMNSAAAMIRQKPLSTLGVGVLVVLAAPAVIAFLFLTVFGIPLALMIGAIYLAAAPLAFAGFIYFLGMLGRRLVAKDTDEAPGAVARLVWSAIAVGVAVIIALIPILGGLVWFIGYILGMGAVMTRGGKALALKA